MAQPIPQCNCGTPQPIQVVCPHCRRQQPPVCVCFLGAAVRQGAGGACANCARAISAREIAAAIVRSNSAGERVEAAAGGAGAMPVPPAPAPATGGVTPQNSAALASALYGTGRSGGAPAPSGLFGKGTRFVSPASPGGTGGIGGSGSAGGSVLRPNRCPVVVVNKL